jgi:hypothetical protein
VILSLNDARFDRTSTDISRGLVNEHRRRYDERVYRRVSSAIDRACDEVERVNLAGGGECPPAVCALVAQLQRMAGEPVGTPSTSLKAHEELFRLSSVLLGRPEADVENELLIEQEAER